MRIAPCSFVSWRLVDPPLATSGPSFFLIEIKRFMPIFERSFGIAPISSSPQRAFPSGFRAFHRQYRIPRLKASKYDRGCRLQFDAAWFDASPIRLGTSSRLERQRAPGSTEAPNDRERRVNRRSNGSFRRRRVEARRSIPLANASTRAQSSPPVLQILGKVWSGQKAREKDFSSRYL